ncbi:CapA family protein [Pontibacter virosus]|uniref:Poly-gamma-glutamate synthesis protein (Capsule biosynthesis protein) n=1 Tax=Pontibacter virosus TaxID=1765052 RepID=A0A2U1ARN2_9BACT|nr:CapA family protein [Pontibacter virosus]PVY39033.1 poly-gamma-glutamate synthesis protein (capsule biosynthesis protein) [Pontibacter virosus]
MDNLKLLFVGDVVIRHQVEDRIIHPDFAAVIKAHEIVSCNFEAPLITPDASPIRKAGPHVFQHDCAIKALDEAGFNLFSLANNHIYDYGYEALQHTLEGLKGRAVIGAGLAFEDAYKPQIITRHGLTVGLFSLAEWGFGAFTDKNGQKGGYAWLNHESVNASIKEARQHCDFVVVQVHAGVEEMDFPLPEWRARYRELIDLGADVIIGHHPHVPQGWEHYQDGLIFYSLGNFYFDAQSSHPLWNVGYAVSLSLQKDQKPAFEVIPIVKKGNQILLNQDNEFIDHLSHITGILDSANYSMLANEEALKLWETVYSHYYSFASNGVARSDSAYSLLKVIYRWLFKKNRTQQHLFLLHNLKIESHRFAVERALQQMIDKV